MKYIGFVIILSVLLFVFPSSVKAQVVINEFSSYSSSGDWVELYAIEDTDISGWILRDTADSKMETIPNGITIGPSSSNFYVAEVGNRLNVGGDLIKLLKPDDLTIVNQVAYGDQGGVCAPGDSESAGRVDNGNTIERFSTPTKGATNIGATLNPCPTPTSAPTSTPSPTSAPTTAPTATPVPTPTKTPTPKPTIKSTPTESPSVLGEETSLIPTISPTPTATPLIAGEQKTFPFLPVFLIIAGLGCVSIAGFSLLRKAKSGYNGENGENP